MKTLRVGISLIIFVFIFTACDDEYQPPIGAFNSSTEIEITDYRKLENWAAHPDKEDTADRIPGESFLSNQENLQADVFYLHPTTLLGNKGDTSWNASIDDVEVNKLTDESPILLQASIFNEAGKVYAPRYQQAHIEVYYTEDSLSSNLAKAFAYEDVKASFEYYLKNYNQDRPFIIASHSQGTTHAKRLLEEFIDGKPLQNKMIAAYLVGIMVKKNQYKNIQPCENPLDLSCIISWRSWRKDARPDEVKMSEELLTTNPLSWTITDEYVSKENNKGGVLRDFDKVYDHLADAQVGKGILMVSKPSFFGSFFYTTKNYHIADYNFFYFNVRENAVARVEQYFNENTLPTE